MPESNGSMQPELADYALAERRLHLLHALADSLRRAQAAVVKSDFPNLDRQTALQRELCEKLRPLPGRIVSSSGHDTPTPQECQTELPEGGISAVAEQRWQALLAQSRQAEAQLAQLNLAYGALLRRARRTVDIFCRLLGNSAITYTPPKAATTTLPGVRR